MAQVHSKYVFDYSTKNIPIPTKKEYLIQLLYSVEKFIRNLKWRAHFFLNPSNRQSKETYGFKSIKAAPIVKDIRNFDNHFLNKLRSDLNEVNELSELIVSADKTSNHYKMTKEDYLKLVEKNIHKNYKKEDVMDDVKLATSEQQDIVTKLDLQDRVMSTKNRKAYITLKDTKENFERDPTCRLINPQKPEIGRISKQVLSRIVENVKKKTKLRLWKNTDSVIDWFLNLEDHQNLKFISFDIKDYYANITEEVFDEAIAWA